MSDRVDLTVNDQPAALRTRAGATLLEALRDDLGLVGTKQGCDRGECGSCTVLIDDQPALACLVLASACGGRSVVTVEGVGTDQDPHPLQVAFVTHDALQCGFCTPGQVMAGLACLQAGHGDTDERVRAWMAGNLCRCAAYPQIVAAIRSVSR